MLENLSNPLTANLNPLNISCDKLMIKQQAYHRSAVIIQTLLVSGRACQHSDDYENSKSDEHKPSSMHSMHLLAVYCIDPTI